MSTNGIIAEPYGDGWRGRYHHWDSYPSGLGARLHELIHTEGVEAVRQRLIREHESWATIVGGSDGPQERCFCHAPGHENDENYWFLSHEEPGCERWVYVLGPTEMVIEHHHFIGKKWTFVEAIPYTAWEVDWKTLDASCERICSGDPN